MSTRCRLTPIVRRAVLAAALIPQLSLMASAPKPSRDGELPKTASDVDWMRAANLHQRAQSGDKLSAEDRAYYNRARELRATRAGAARASNKGDRNNPIVPRESVGLVPLTDLKEPYKGETGGLYGDGRNMPPDAHFKAAEAELAKIQPLDADGMPADDGLIAFVSISMSNATMEFSHFKRLADADPLKSPQVAVVDCAQGGQAMAEWVDPQARAWQVADQRLTSADVSPRQVQVAWIKLANKVPQGELKEHGKKLRDDTLQVIQNAKARFPNLRIAYLGSRTYGGYASNSLNPEPYAYESAFAARWLIQEQIAGDKELNYDAAQGRVRAPLLLWGPYFWADGMRPRADGVQWTREDFVGDGVHPSESGREIVAQMLLKFLHEDALARPWYVSK